MARFVYLNHLVNHPGLSKFRHHAMLPLPAKLGRKLGVTAQAFDGACQIGSGARVTVNAGDAILVDPGSTGSGDIGCNNWFAECHCFQHYDSKGLVACYRRKAKQVASRHELHDFTV